MGDEDLALFKFHDEEFNRERVLDMLASFWLPLHQSY